MDRPSHLPDFTSPPLEEVVLGVQFEPCAGYQQIRAGEVWALYKDAYPIVEEREPIQPVFETFGLPAGPQFNFGVVTGAQHDRFWFIAEDQAELIQFQQDRLMHNWRKTGDRKNKYPRFESMISSFESEALKLDDYFKKLSSSGITINQCEISYINIINLENKSGLKELSEWINLVNPDPLDSDDANLVFRSALVNAGTPIGRVHCQINSARGPRGAHVARLEITVRGIPATPNFAGAIDFIKAGREIIVETFAKITTDSAHKAWGRIA